MNKIAFRILALSIAFIGFGLGIWMNDEAEFTEITTNAATPSIKIEVYPPDDLIAKSILVYDLNNDEVIFSKDSNISRPLASLTKLMTVYAGGRLFGNNDVISEDNKTFKDLSDMSLIASSNEAAEKIAIAGGEKLGGVTTEEKTKLFVNYMNMVSDDLDLKARFKNATGLDIEDEPGAEGSAEDVIKLSTALLDSIPDIFERSSFTSVTWGDGSATNTNKLIHTKPFILTSKTGLTTTAGGNLLTIIILPINNPVAIVVLGSTESGRFQDVDKLVDFVSEKYSNI